MNMMPANLYLNQIDPCHYWPANATIQCENFLSQLRTGTLSTKEYPFLTTNQLQAFKTVLEAETYLPPIPQLTIPQPVEAGLFPINEPDRNSIVIVSGNNQYTFELLASIWAQGITPAYFLLLDCLGNTVDMAVLYGDFTSGRLLHILKETSLEEKVAHRHLIVPGYTRSLAQDFAKATGWEVEVGPVCAVELPLYLEDRWLFPSIRSET